MVKVQTTSSKKATMTLNKRRRSLVNMQEWLENKATEQERLYEQYGKPLENKHMGEYVAISLDGQTILGQRIGELLREAIHSFGSGNFAIARVGHDTVERWRQIAA